MSSERIRYFVTARVPRRGGSFSASCGPRTHRTRAAPTPDSSRALSCPGDRFSVRRSPGRLKGGGGRSESAPEARSRRGTIAARTFKVRRSHRARQQPASMEPSGFPAPYLSVATALPTSCLLTSRLLVLPERISGPGRSIRHVYKRDAIVKALSRTMVTHDREAHDNFHRGTYAMHVRVVVACDATARLGRGRR